MKARARVTVAGLSLVLASVLLDKARGLELSFGLLQTLMAAAGLAGVAYGALGSKLSSAWSAAGVVVLNTLLVFLLVNVAANTALQRIPGGRYAGAVTLPWYAAQPWNAAYRADFPKVNDLYRFARWVMWEGAPFRGQVMNVDSAGRRRTPGDDCTGDPYVIWALGGSTMWGVGSPDSLTIPARLKEALGARGNRPICVVNLGERAYNSSQEVLRLQRELSRGGRPDLVVTYDGLNDATYAMRSAKAGAFQDEDEVAQRIYQRTPAADWMNSLAVMRLADEVRRRSSGRDTLLAFQAPGVNVDSLVRATAEVHSANHRLIAALGQGFNFEVLFFLQPMIAVGSKPLSKEEQSSMAAMRVAQRDFYRGAFAAMKSAADARNADGPSAPLIDLRTVFDAEPRALYFDWFHIAPPGNALVAERIANVIEGSPSFQRFLRGDRSASK